MSERHGGRCCSAVDEIWRVTMRNLLAAVALLVILAGCESKAPAFSALRA